MDNSTMFQKIYDCISLYVSIDWKKIVFYAEYEEGSYTIEFYVKDFNNKYIKCYALPNVDEDAMYDSFVKLNDVIESNRKKIDKKQLWSNMTMIINDKLEFSVNFDYTNLIDEESFDYKDHWKKQYLI